MKIGDEIKKFRLKKGLTQTQLGAQIDKSLRMIQKYESGVVIPNLKVLDKIADTLEVPVTKLIPVKIEKKIKDLLSERNIPFEKMVDDTGLLLYQGLLIQDNQDHDSIYPKEILQKIAKFLNISFNELVDNTTVEDWYIFDSEEQKAIDLIASKINDLRKNDTIGLKERREMNNIAIKTMAMLLNISEDDVVNFEKESYKHPKLISKYKEVLMDFETFSENLLTQIINSKDFDLRYIASLPSDQYTNLINYITKNIIMVTDMLKSS